uniref:Ig-like domain-containing protein n=1 Tax=Lates calcarifer TaxID=8187 RepID=A0A4W6C9I5_LATCA
DDDDDDDCSITVISKASIRSSEDLVKPSKDVMMALEGDTVTLSCSYSQSVQSLYWYQQKFSSSPQLLITDYSETIPRLSLKHDKETMEFHLQISSAAVTDSAVYYCLYYCALRNTFTVVNTVYLMMIHYQPYCSAFLITILC